MLEKLSTLLEIDRVSFGALEVEQLSWGSPSLRGEPVVRQLEGLLAVQRDAGRRLFLLAVTAETDSQLDAAVAATKADRVFIGLLLASTAVVAARLQEREPDDWPGKVQLVHHARRLAVSMRCLSSVDVRLSTEEDPPREIARRLPDAARTAGVLA